MAALQAIPILLLPLALSISPTILSHTSTAALFLPLIYGIHIYSYMYLGGEGLLASCHMAWSTELLFFKDPRRDARLIHYCDLEPEPGKGDGTGTWLESYPDPLGRRIFWVLTLMCSLRYTTFTFTSSQSPRHKYSSKPLLSYNPDRSSAIISNVVRCAFHYLVMDAIATYALTDPWLHQFEPLSSPLPASTAALLSLIHPYLATSSLLARAIRLSLITSQFITAIGGTYALTTLLFISLPSLFPATWSSPRVWPPPYGPLSSIFTHGLKGLWGSFWHRSLRPWLLSPALVLLPLLPQSFQTPPVGRALIATCVFFYSGVIHAPVARYRQGEPWAMAAFFWLQGVGVLVEMLIVDPGVKWVAGGRKESWVGRGVRGIWVLGWLNLTLPFVMRGFIGAGFWDLYPVPVRVVCRIWGNC